MTKHLLIDEREVVFVKYPTTMTGAEVVARLNWAKWWKVDQLYTEFIIRCGVKPHYLKHFIKDNPDNRLWFSKTELGYQVKTEPDCFAIFEE